VKKYFAVIGNPISHSLSPQIMNMAFLHHKFEGLYSRVLLNSFDEFLLLDELINFEGCNATSPFKADVAAFSEDQSESVIRTGVANTMKKKDTGHWFVHNTDITGVVLPIARRFDDLKEKKILVIGAGGASRAAIVGMLNRGASVWVTNRTNKNAKKLSEVYECNFLSTSELKEKYPYFDIILNTVGVILPEMNDYHPGESQWLMDASYKEAPFKSYFPEEDERYIDGKKWLVAQAIEGFKLFTGIESEDEIFIKGLERSENVRHSSIVLIGPMGAGKTTIGRKIAELSGFHFVDLDEEIENHEGNSISNIFDEKGESYFRNLESQLLSTFSEKDNIVLSCGGGVVTKQSNVEILSKLHTVLLMVDAKTTVERITTLDRPLLHVDDPIKRAKEILSNRLDQYLLCAHAIVNAQENSIEKTAELIRNDFESTMTF